MIMMPTSSQTKSSKFKVEDPNGSFSVGLQLLRSEIVKEFFQNLFRMILHDEIEIHPQIVHLWWDILYLLIKITSVPEP